MERLIIGISGASGVQCGMRALELLKPLPIETHLIMSKSAELTVHHELGCSVENIRELADEWHPVRNVGAAVASGSFRTMGMLIAPCSIRTLGEITSGVTSSLLTRAADVVLKERRRLERRRYTLATYGTWFQSPKWVLWSHLRCPLSMPSRIR